MIVCDGLASEDPAKAEAFNAMVERRRDRSTVEFRTLSYLRNLFEAARLGDPKVDGSMFPTSRPTATRARFRQTVTSAGLLAMIEATVEGDSRRALDARTHQVRLPLGGAHSGQARLTSGDF